MIFSSNFKQNEVNLRLLLARLLVEFQKDSENLERYIAKINKKSSENIYNAVDEIFSQLDFIENRVIFIRYGTLNEKPLTYQDVSTILGLKEEYVATIDIKAIQRLKSLGIKDSLERLINKNS